MVVENKEFLQWLDEVKKAQSFGGITYPPDSFSYFGNYPEDIWVKTHRDGDIIISIIPYRVKVTIDEYTLLEKDFMVI